MRLIQSSFFVFSVFLFAGCGSSTPPKAARFSEYFRQEIPGRGATQPNAKYLVSSETTKLLDQVQPPPTARYEETYTTFALSLHANGRFSLVYSVVTLDHATGRPSFPDMTRSLEGAWRYEAEDLVLEGAGRLEYAVVSGEAGAIFRPSATAGYEPAQLGSVRAVGLVLREGRDGYPPRPQIRR